MSKRENDEAESGSRALVKRAKGAETGAGGGERSREIVRASEGSIVTTKARRTSDLEAATMKVTGHKASVTSVAFAPGGAAFASGGFDGTIMLWNTFGPIASYGNMHHKKAVTSVVWGSDGAYLYSSSADGSACVWDSETQVRVKKAREHRLAVVNDIDVCVNEPNVFATCADDGSARLWDVRHRRAAAVCQARHQQLSVSLSSDGALLYSAGVDGVIRCFDVRRNEEALLELAGHREAVTSLSLSRDGAYLLSYSRDNSARIWDAKPFSSRANRQLKLFVGGSHDAENHLLRASWSPDGSQIAAGSVDRCLYVWSTTSRDILYKLPGHKGVVNAVVYHPTQPIVLTAGADKCMFLGELAD